MGDWVLFTGSSRRQPLLQRRRPRGPQSLCRADSGRALLWRGVAGEAADSARAGASGRAPAKLHVQMRAEPWPGLLAPGRVPPPCPQPSLESWRPEPPRAGFSSARRRRGCVRLSCCRDTSRGSSVFAGSPSAPLPEPTAPPDPSAHVWATPGKPR